MKLQIVKGSTSQILTVFIQDDTATDGVGLGSLIHTSSIAGGYVRTGSVGLAIAVDEDVSVEGTYEAPSTAAHVRIGTPANMISGVYELHFHNDLFAAGADSIVIGLAGAADMAPLLIEVQLTDVDLNDGVHGGMTALPAAAAGANGGVFLGSTGGAVAATGLDLVLKTSTFALAIADAIWDEILTGATHNVATSAGRRLREIAGAVALTDGTAQSGTNNTIVLELGENANNDWYNHTRIVLTGGTGAGQSRHIHDYDGGTLAATVYPVWVTNPSNDTTYEIYPEAMVHAMEIEADGITNASFAADVGSTVYATNIIALAVRKALDDYGSPTVAQFNARTRLDADYFSWGTDTVTLANGAHGGAAASLTLETFVVSNAAGDAVTFESTGGDGCGFVCQGHGSSANTGEGAGVYFHGGANGSGAQMTGGITDGFGLDVSGVKYGSRFRGRGADADAIGLWAYSPAGYGMVLSGKNEDLWLSWLEAGFGGTNIHEEIKGAGWDSGTDTLEEIRDALGSGVVTLAADQSAVTIGTVTTVTNDVSIANDQSTVTVGTVNAIAEAGMLSIADEVLKRGAENVEDDAEDGSLCESLLARFESNIVDTTWTIYKTNHTDTFNTRTVTLDDTADPVTGVT